jgi:hypothetical protein
MLNHPGYNFVNQSSKNRYNQIMSLEISAIFIP